MKAINTYLDYVLEENKRLHEEIKYLREYKYNKFPSVIKLLDEDAQFYDVSTPCNVLQFKMFATAGVEKDLYRMGYHFFTETYAGPMSFQYHYWINEDNIQNIQNVHNVADLLSNMNQKVLHEFHRKVIEEREREKA